MKRILFALTLLLCPSAFAVLPATAQWDVRTTGSDTNGGCFDPGVTSPGTDFSQQNSAQVAFTDLVIGGTTTQLTSVANPFTSTSVGNCINITGGTGFTVGRYNVRSVAAGVATMDRSVGTGASTGGTGNLGGSMASPVTAMAAIVSLNTVWMKAGTYTITAQVGNTSGASFSLIGYSAAHGDNLAGAIITTATNSTTLIFFNGATTNAWIHNLALSNTAAIRGNGVTTNAALNLVVSNCTMTGFASAIEGVSHGATSIHVLNTWVAASTGTGINVPNGLGFIQDSVISGGAVGINFGSTPASIVSRTLIIGNGLSGITISTDGHLEIYDSTIANNTSNGVQLNNGGTYFTGTGVGFVAQNNIIYGNGGAGISLGVAPIPSVANVYMNNNAYGNNTAGNHGNIPAGIGDVTLTANPFTSSGTGDYSLNSTAGGGAALKGTGFPGLFSNGTTTGHLDFGAAQSAGGGGTAASNYGVSN